MKSEQNDPITKLSLLSDKALSDLMDFLRLSSGPAEQADLPEIGQSIELARITPGGKPN